MSDTLDFINFLELQDNDAGNKMRDKLADLRERRRDLQDTTGARALTFQEFQREHPPEKPNRLTNVLTGGALWAAIGAAAGALLSAATQSPEGMLPFAGMGALAGGAYGGIAGIYSETTTTKRGEVVDEYERYLDAFEHAHGRGRAPAGHDVSALHTRSDHGERELARRAKADPTLQVT